MKESLSKDLLFDFFDGRATSMERKLVEDWLADPQNEELYYQYLDEWESRHPQFTARVENAFVRYQSLLASRQAVDHPLLQKPAPLSKPLHRKLWLSGAAAACILLGLGYLFRTPLLYKSLTSNNGQIANYHLPDGTRVVLNANSTLLVPRFGFGKGTREVRLEGEAEFNVIHTKSDDRFIVRMNNDLLIEVLGTEFVAYSRERGTKVFLTKGKVKLRLPKGKQLYMKPGNLFSTDPKGGFAITSPAAPEQFVAWKQEMFYFNNTLLSEVAEQMKDRFKVDVRIPDSVLARQRIGGIYKAKQVGDLLEILSQLLQLEVVKHNEYIELRKSVNNLNP